MKGSYVALLLTVTTVYVVGHGRLWNPPSRGTEHRRGYDIPWEKKDYTDNELFCGGKLVQWGQNGGQCGVCGDDIRLPEPRPHEDYGVFDNNVITGHYSAGQLIDVTVQLTTNHLGFFEFDLCPRDSKQSSKLTDGCFSDLYNHKGESKVNIGSAKGFREFKVQLPAGVTGRESVLRWIYTTGNDSGVCKNGTVLRGCSAEPEQFYGCADISIQ